MKNSASKSGNTLFSAPHWVPQGAHFDFTVVSAGEFDDTPDCSADPLNLLVRGLQAGNKSTALLDCGHFDDPGYSPSSLPGSSAPNAVLRKVVARRSNSTVCVDGDYRFHSLTDKVFYAAGKLLFLHDRLFNLKQGGEFVRNSVSAARSAGRTTVLLCTDLSTIFFKRQEITESFGGFPDCVVGEPSAVLCLSGLNRLDSLAPRFMQLGTGLVLFRVNYPPIVVRPEDRTVETGDCRISREEFWTDFVPSSFDSFLASGTRTG